MSRKLDARVAEKVMGLKPEPYDESEVLYLHDNIGCPYEIPNYSTDMNAAMEVIAKLTSMEASIQECTYSKIWSVDFEGKVEGRSHWEGKGTADHKSLPTAICLAALRAVGDGEWVDEYLKEMI